MELWKDVVGWEDLYEVSNLGDVRSKYRKYRTNYGLRGCGDVILRPVLCGNGYLAVNLTGVGRKRQQLTVHRMVLSAFVGTCPEGMEACHNNGVRHDCKLTNLRWDTRKNNHADKKTHGTAQILGPCAKLNRELVMEILNSRDKTTELAKRCGVSVVTIWRVKTNRSWKNIQ